MKKLIAAFAAVAAFSAHAETLTVAASPVPHAEILEFVKPALAKEGVDLKVKVFTDYMQRRPERWGIIVAQPRAPISSRIIIAERLTH